MSPRKSGVPRDDAQERLEAAETALAEAEATLDEAETDEDFAEAWAAVQQAVEVARRSGDREALEDAWSLALSTYAEMPEARDDAGLVAAVEKDLGRDDVLAIVARGLVALYGGEAGSAEAARASFAAACEREPENAFAHFYLGCALERVGGTDDARRELARAAELEPDAYCAPLDLAPGELDAVVEEALAELPPEIAEVVGKECVVEVQDFPEERLVREGIDPLVLGLFVGPEHGERTSGVAEAPSQVLLFLRNLAKECRDRDELVEEVRVTLFHEIGHALGFDEDGVDDLGLA